MQLSEFLLRRIAEDEAVAREAQVDDVERWAPFGLRYDSKFDAQVMIPDGETVAHVATTEDAAHIARHDPGRVLAECEAKRRIVEEHGGGADPCDAHDASFETIPCDTLRALALPYADHPDFRAEWAL